MRIVLDTNVIVRGLGSPRSYSRQILDACDARRVILLLSKPVVREYRAVLTGRDVMQRQPAITPERVGIVLLRLQYVSAYLRRVGAQFSLARDSQDEKFIELAIAGNATHLLSFDNDLLSLPSGRNDDAKRFRQRLPRILVQSPDEFVNSNRELFEGQ